MFPRCCMMLLDRGSCKSRLENRCPLISSASGPRGAMTERWISGFELDLTAPVHLCKQRSEWWMERVSSHFAKPCSKHTLLWWKCWTVCVQNLHLLGKESRAGGFCCSWPLWRVPGFNVQWQFKHKDEFQWFQFYLFRCSWPENPTGGCTPRLSPLTFIWNAQSLTDSFTAITINPSQWEKEE